MSVIATAAPRAPGYHVGVALVLCAGSFWSLMGLLVRLVEDASIWQILFYRSLALTLFLLVVIGWRTRGRVWQTVCDGGLAFILGGYALMLAFAGSIAALKTTSVASAMFLFATAPFITAVLARILLKERVRSATWIAMSVAIIGIVIMVFDALALGQLFGNLAALGSAIGFALFTIALRRSNSRDMFPAVFLGGLYTTLLSGAICMATGDGLVVSVADASYAILMGVGLLGAGMMIYTIGSRSVPAAELALLSMTEVVLGPVWVWLLLGETVTTWTLAGGVILLGALAGNALSGLRRRPMPVGLQ